jgi:hypothetical protein
MAKFNGIFSNMNGSVGDVTVRRVKGVTYVSQKITHTTNARSLAQQNQRSKWLNALAVYKSFSGNLFHFSFEGKKDGQSDYNLFVQNAMKHGPAVYITRAMKDGGFCVASSYVVSQGSLDSIQVVYDADRKAFVSNVQVGDAFTINDDTTIGELSNRVVVNDGRFSHGDKLTGVIMQQRYVNEGDEYMRCKAVAYAMTLNSYDGKAVKGLFPTLTVVNNCLAMTAEPTSAGTFILTRKSHSGDVLTSTQNFVLGTKAEEYAAKFRTESARTATIESIGGYNTSLLDPSSGNVSYVNGTGHEYGSDESAVPFTPSEQGGNGGNGSQGGSTSGGDGEDLNG